MAKETTDDLRDALAAWFPPSQPQPDAELAALLLDLKARSTGGALLRWQRGDVTRLLLSDLPRQVLVTGEDAPEILTALSMLLRFLEQSGRLTRDSSTAVELSGEVSEAQLRVALDDPGLWSPRKALLQNAASAGIDVGDDDALSDYLTAALGLASGGGLELPARRVAAAAELAEAARGVPAFAAAVRLATWIGEGRAARTGFLTKDVAQEAQEALGVGPDELRATWQRSQEWGLLEVMTRKARGCALPETDEEWFGAWLDCFGFSLEEPPYAEEHRIWHAPVDEGVLTLLCLAYATPEGLPHDDAVAEVWDILVEQELGGAAPSERTAAPLRTGLTGYLDERLDAMRSLGVLTTERTLLELTPLGVAGVAAIVEEAGGSAPTFASTGELDAGEVLDLVGFCVEPVLEEWAAGRDPAEAASELVSAASTRGPGPRAAAFGVVSELGPAALPVVEPWTDHPTLGPYARSLLAGNEPRPEDALWLTVELAACALDTEDLLREQFDQVPLVAYEELVDRLWRTDHPDAVGVLEALGRHPDKRRAKPARKAAFKAHSRA